MRAHAIFHDYLCKLRGMGIIMRVLVIDGQGGGLGRCIVERLREVLPAAEIIAVGTNTAATSNMLKGGANIGATGENPVIYNSSRADIIVGPIGILLPNAMAGEISPAMAAAIAGSGVKLVLLPITKCQAYVAGVKDMTLPSCIEEAVEIIKKLI